LKIQSEPNSNCRLKCIELFAGAGGLALGVHKAGFEHLALIEWDNMSTQTLRANCKSHLNIDEFAVIEADVRDVDLCNYEGNVDLLAAGPPCRPFSTAGKNLAEKDSRDMFPILINKVAEIMPKAILIENVRGLTRPKFSVYFEYLIMQLKFPKLEIKENEPMEEHLIRLRNLKPLDFNDDETYVVESQLVDATDFGLPQRRQRVFISAFRSDLNLSPSHLAPTHSSQALYYDQWVTGHYWDRHEIPSDDYLGPLPQYIPKAQEEDLKPWKTVRDAITNLPPPVLRGDPEIIPNHVQVPGARVYRCHTGSYYDRPAKALKAGTHGTPGGENMVITSQQGDVRYFTTREAARLQTFDDEWCFRGKWGHCIRQLGDAVPVDLAKSFAIMIHSKLQNAEMGCIHDEKRGAI